VTGPVPVVLAAALSWLVGRPDGGCPAERPAGIQRSGVVAVSARPGCRPWRRSPGRVHQVVSTQRLRRSCPAVQPSSVRPSGVRPSGVQPVRCPAGPVSSRPVSSRPVSSRPVSSRPVSGRLLSASVRPDASSRPPQAAAVGTRSVRRQPSPPERVESRWAAASWSGSMTAEQARTRAMLPGSRWLVGSVRTRARWVRRAAALDRLSDQAGQTGVRSARGWRLRGGHGSRLQREGAAAAGWLPSGAEWRPRWVVVMGPAARVGGSGRADGRAGRMGVRPQRGPAWRRALPARYQQRCDLREWLVGLPGLEPGTSSLSAITRLPLCNPTFLQVARDRQRRSNALFEESAKRDRGRLPSPITGVHGAPIATVSSLRLCRYLHRSSFSAAYAALLSTPTFSEESRISPARW
jgi:hypothetical protein